MSVRVAAVAAAALVALSGAAGAAGAALGDEIELAERHAPVVRLVEQLEECGPGEPYEPMDVDALFDEPTVALRGPWNALDLIEVGPTADDLADLYEYHLDFPGAALDPGCSYERWANRVTEGHAPTVYAHVATDPDRPGQLALQYWLFYAYNDWNNLHEGDWENVQLIFDVADARAALAQDPVAVGYSQHEGTERAEWNDEKLELVDGRRPVVYPAAGSHANFFDDALFLGSSAEQGVGCDDTRGPHEVIEPEVVTIPSDAAAARRELPWITFEGRWGELQEAFFNGPTGPNMKRSWTEPIVASEEWRERAYAVPTGGLFGTQATDGFCSVVARGSSALVRLLRDPEKTLLVLVALVALAAFATTRTTWRPTAPLRAGRRRAWGQILAGAGRMYLAHAPLFIGIGLLLIPVSLLIALVQAIVFGAWGSPESTSPGRVRERWRSPRSPSAPRSPSSALRSSRPRLPVPSSGSTRVARSARSRPTGRHWLARGRSSARLRSRSRCAPRSARPSCSPRSRSGSPSASRCSRRSWSWRARRRGTRFDAAARSSAAAGCGSRRSSAWAR